MPTFVGLTPALLDGRSSHPLLLCQQCEALPQECCLYLQVLMAEMIQRICRSFEHNNLGALYPPEGTGFTARVINSRAPRPNAHILQFTEP